MIMITKIKLKIRLKIYQEKFFFSLTDKQTEIIKQWTSLQGCHMAQDHPAVSLLIGMAKVSC